MARYGEICRARASLQKVILLSERMPVASVQDQVRRTPYILVSYNPNREKILRQLGSNVRRERTKRGIAQARLAQLSGINSRTVAKIEAGELNIKPETLRRISRAIGCAVEELNAETIESMQKGGVVAESGVGKKNGIYRNRSNAVEPLRG